MALQRGRYQTRNVRLVDLLESFQREKRNSDGSTQMITVWRGTLLTADGKTPDSTQEWEESHNPMMLGAWCRPGKAEGIATEFDLIAYIGPLGAAA